MSMRPLARLFHALSERGYLDEEAAFTLIEAYEDEVIKAEQERVWGCEHLNRTLDDLDGRFHCDRCGARVEPGAAS